MTTVAMPRMRRRIRDFSAVKRVKSVLSGYLRPARPVLANLAQVPLTVMGLGCIDIGIFVANAIAGWIVTGISLMVLEHIISDDR